MNSLSQYIAAELERSVASEVVVAARTLAAQLGGSAVLFYGSVLRTGDLEGVLDFYVLREPRQGTGIVRRYLWPDVSYHEFLVSDRLIRAKVATMPIDIFTRAARGEMFDTTIWARFVQPSALVWAESCAVRPRVIDAVAAAAVTAARFAVLHGPEGGAPSVFWRALFRATYATELRVEAAGREDQILSYHRARYDALLPLAWAASALPFDRDGASLAPKPTREQVARLAQAWAVRKRTGKLLNSARLVKAAFTFDGAANYALWKIERHTGVRIAATPFRQRHPIIAAPGVLWRLWRHSRAR